MDWRETLGRNVRRLRHSQGLSQEALADAAEIDPTYLRGIEAGRRNPSLLVMVRLAEALNTSAADLLVV